MATVVLGTVGRSVAAVVAAAAVFAMWAEVAQAADPDQARATWSPGPEVQISKPRIVRLSADRILALRVEPSSCVHDGVMGYCRVPVYDAAPALVIDVHRGTSTPAAGPPDGMELGSQAVGVDGDAFIGGINRKGGSDTEVLLRYVGAEDRWEVLPLPPGVKSFESGHQMVVVGRRFVVVSAGPHKTRTSAGVVLGSDGRWRTLPPNPLQEGGFSALPMDGGVLTFQNTKEKALVASLAISDDGRAAPTWRRLPPASRPVGVDSYVAVIGHYLTWHYATYDLRTGRMQLTPEELRNPERALTVPDGLMLGRRFTVGGALFDPSTRGWIPIPATGSSPRSTEEGNCGHVGGPDNLIRLCEPPDKIDGAPGFPTVIADGGPGTIEVLRVSDDAADR